MRSTLLFLALLSLIIFGLVGCSRTPLKPPNLDDYRLSSPEELAKVLLALSDRVGGVDSYRGVFRVKASRGLVSDRFLQVVSAKAPGNFRLDIFDGALNRLQMHAVIGEERLSVYDVREKSAYEGASSRALMEKLFSVPLASYQLFPLLLGDLPPLRDVRSQKLYMNRVRDECIFQLNYFDERGEMFWLDPCIVGAPKLRRFEVQKAESEVELWAEYVFSDNLTTPSSLTFHLPDEGVEIEVRYDKLTLNPVLSDQVFQFRAPPNIPLQSLD